MRHHHHDKPSRRPRGGPARADPEGFPTPSAARRIRSAPERAPRVAPRAAARRPPDNPPARHLARKSIRRHKRFCCGSAVQCDTTPLSVPGSWSTVGSASAWRSLPKSASWRCGTTGPTSEGEVPRRRIGDSDSACGRNCELMFRRDSALPSRTFATTPRKGANAAHARAHTRALARAGRSSSQPPQPALRGSGSKAAARCARARRAPKAPRCKTRPPPNTHGATLA